MINLIDARKHVKVSVSDELNPPDPPDPYKDCCFYEKNVCGSWKHCRVLQEGLVSLGEVEKNTLDDFFRYHLHSKESPSEWNEKKLIENRAGTSLSAAKQDMSIS